MGDGIYIGRIGKGLTTNPLPFNIDNDAFPTMYNFYSWRGRIKRKRGTLPFARLQRQLQSATSPNQWQVASVGTLSGAGALSTNLITVLVPVAQQATASIVPGSISLTDGTNTWVDTAQNGTLTGTPAGTGTINYATGAITFAGGVPAQNIIGFFSYYPGLPVMGLEDFVSPSSTTLYPLQLSFDTTYSYQVKQTSSTLNYYSTSYYKNSNNPVVWTGTNYQQFFTCNYSGALWATNNKSGFHFKIIQTILVGATTTITSSTNHGMVTGDYVYFSELTGADAASLNLQSFVVTVTGATTFTVAVNTGGMVINNAGIFQTLTVSVAGQDGIRWYDGDPTGQTGLPTSTGLGWVNFSPPLTAASVSIDNTPSKLWYLVGALGILPFKDRLLFFSPWIQGSTGAAIQLTDTVLWSWNGTPYYNALVPTGETFDVRAYYVDQTGLGGYLPAGIPNPIRTISNNEDVLLIGFGGDGRKTRFSYTGNDLQPFLFYNINSELPSTSTFSAITLDTGAIDIGQYGIAMTDQQSSQRIDLQIPDAVFQIQALNNGADRVNAIRDFFKEWIYFSYPIFDSQWVFPTRTFLLNYRDNTWAILYENFTKHGTYRSSQKRSWNTIGYPSWDSWREPWNSGSNSPQFPSIIAGNPQGFVVTKGIGTSEAPTGQIQALASASGGTRISCINHCVAEGDYIQVLGCLGTTAINGQIGRVNLTTDGSGNATPNTFVVDIPFPAGTYLGLGTFTRLSQPLLQTKQFNPYWDQGRQVRLSVQKYLMDTTQESQVTLNIYLSQNPDESWNDPQNQGTPSNSLIYSQVLYTCPESTNLGLTPQNTNLQQQATNTIGGTSAYQMWHRESTSLVGDSFQVGITLSDAQMRNLTYATSEIAIHAMHFVVNPSMHLA